MIIDSHAHYNSGAFKNTFRYLAHKEDGYALAEGARNTSLILPAVAQKIAELKGISTAEVENAATQNTIELFHLPI